MQAAPTMSAAEAPSLTAVLAAIRKAARDDSLAVRDVLAEIGERSFAAALLMPALILVSPISGIPGTPTIGALIVILVVMQWLVGREHLWLPEFIIRRTVATGRIRSALAWFDRPAAFIDRHSFHRLAFLTEGPLSVLPLLTVLAIAATWPVLEFLPFLTTIGAFAVLLFAFGLMMQDGAYVVTGYVFVAGLVLAINGLI